MKLKKEKNSSSNSDNATVVKCFTLKCPKCGSSSLSDQISDAHHESVETVACDPDKDDYPRSGKKNNLFLACDSCGEQITIAKDSGVSGEDEAADSLRPTAYHGDPYRCEECGNDVFFWKNSGAEDSIFVCTKCGSEQDLVRC